MTYLRLPCVFTTNVCSVCTANLPLTITKYNFVIFKKKKKIVQELRTIGIRIQSDHLSMFNLFLNLCKADITFFPVKLQK